MASIYDDLNTFLTAFEKKYGAGATPAGGMNWEQYWNQQKQNVNWMKGLEGYTSEQGTPNQPITPVPENKGEGSGGPVALPMNQSQTPYTGPSIVDYLKSVGQPSDFAHRAALAQQQGIANYTGSADQNTQLLNILRGGGGTTSAPPPATTPPATQPPIALPENPPAESGVLPFPKSQADMEDYQRRQQAGEIYFDGKDWRQGTPAGGTDIPPTTPPVTPPTTPVSPPAGSTTPNTPTAQQQAIMDTYGATLEQISDPNWVRGKISEIMTQIGELEEGVEKENKIKEMVKLAAAMGVDYPEEAIRALTKSFDKTEQELRDELYEKYGIEDLEDKFKEKPTQTFEEIFEAIYDKLNLSDLKSQVDEILKQIAKADEDFNQGAGDINENPWLSEAGRVGQMRRLNDEYERTRSRLDNQRVLLENLYERGKEDAESVATRAISTFDKEREWAKEELDYYLKRAEADIEAKLAIQKETAEKDVYRYYPEYLSSYRPEETPPGAGVGGPTATGIAMVQVSETGKSYDFGTVEGLNAFKKDYPDYSYEEMNAWMDVNVKTLDAATRKSLLEKSDFKKASGGATSTFKDIATSRAKTIEQAKKNGIERETAKIRLIAQFKADLGISASAKLPDQYNDIVEDILYAVYGGTLGQRIVPGGRGGLFGTTQEEMRKNLGLD